MSGYGKDFYMKSSYNSKIVHYKLLLDLLLDCLFVVFFLAGLKFGLIGFFFVWFLVCEFVAA